ncbi:C4-dicarboxylate ABC transporter [Pseudomonas fluorescens]|nr:C4-dicarboxylate ABC transporter [Pseudomonas fluorescens]
MFIVQLIVVLTAIFLGTRISGVGVGLAGGFGLTILVFVFGLQPTSPPIDVMLVIIAVITMVATVHAAGGLDYLVTIAEKILRKYPSRITVIAPLVTYTFTVVCGTAYVAFALYPIIAEIAYDAKVRPERPLSISAVAASQAVTASPMSAATAVLIALVSTHGVSIGQILLTCIPAGLVGVLFGAASVYRRGVELEDDPEFLRRMAAGEIEVPNKSETQTVKKGAKSSLIISGLAILSVVSLGSFPQLMPSWTVGNQVTRLSIPNALEMIMLSFAFIIVFLLKLKPAKIINNSIFTHGMLAVVAIFGIAWMVDTFFHAHTTVMMAEVGHIVEAHPYLFVVALMITSALLLSQGAAIRAIGPLGLSLGVTAAHLVAFFPAAAAVTIIPATGNVIGVVSFDKTGTTKIGKFIFNHSFLRPGLVCNITAVIAAYLISLIVF